jgi:hypothetical protein
MWKDCISHGYISCLESVINIEFIFVLDLCTLTKCKMEMQYLIWSVIAISD